MMHVRGKEVSRAGRIDFADQREFVISPRQWRSFALALDRPARTKPALVRLFKEMSGLRSPSR
jgi:uncharacterized protein (DUF1778 family)